MKYKCPNCDATVEYGKNCPQCGCEIDWSATLKKARANQIHQLATSGNTFTCPDCETPVEPGQNCPKCGYKVDWNHIFGLCYPADNPSKQVHSENNPTDQPAPTSAPVAPPVQSQAPVSAPVKQTAPPPPPPAETFTQSKIGMVKKYQILGFLSSVATIPLTLILCLHHVMDSDLDMIDGKRLPIFLISIIINALAVMISRIGFNLADLTQSEKETQSRSTLGLASLLTPIISIILAAIIIFAWFSD